MSEVKRYWPEEIVGTGELVVYAQDYAALEAERDELRQQLADVFKGNTKLHVLWTAAVQQRDALAALTAGQATVKYPLTVRPSAYAVFADNGNVICFSTQRDHQCLVKLEEEGKVVVALGPVVPTAAGQGVSALVEALERNT